MAKLGDRVLYRAHEDHFTSHEEKTASGVVTHEGSVHHPHLRQFVGIVGRVHGNGACDLALFVPNREVKWVDAVTEGRGLGEFAVREDAEDQALDLHQRVSTVEAHLTAQAAKA